MYIYIYIESTMMQYMSTAGIEGGPKEGATTSIKVQLRTGGADRRGGGCMMSDRLTYSIGPTYSLHCSCFLANHIYIAGSQP